MVDYKNKEAKTHILVLSVELVDKVPTNKQKKKEQRKLYFLLRIMLLFQRN